MTTEHTQSENNDTQANVAEESFAAQAPSSDREAESFGHELSPPAHQTNASETPASQDIAPTHAATNGEEEPTRTFTAIFEEFRQNEERAGDNTPAVTTPAQDNAPVEQSQSSAPMERPVSPLLRPASRLRAPRHGGRHRDRENANTPAATVESSSEQHGQPEQANQPSLAASETTVPTTTSQAETSSALAASVESATRLDAQASEQQEVQKPPRRYRFDRPANKLAAAQSTPTATPIASPAASLTTQATPATARPEYGNGYSSETKESSAPALQNGHETPESAAEKTAAPGETAQVGGAGRHEPRQGQGDRHARNTHIRGHKQERSPEEAEAPTPVASVAPAPISETSVGEVKLEEATAETDLAVEDLPPLEYSELQAANSRRRRRRRPSGNSPLVPKSATSEQPTSLIASPTQPGITTPASPIVPSVPTRPVVPAAPYTIQSGYTVNQMNQGNDATGPFMGPDPSPARGSLTPTPVRSVRPNRSGFGNDGQRSIGSTSVTPVREGGLSSGSINHLANVISQAMQAQTDRMVAELRRANQGPTNISVALPPFPSTERVGVFVDVANLLYSARTMRINIDFGKLLDFLRGNRRLVRAQAYCPTSPQPGDDQMFLQAVKGLGYRITTKDYKTFSSGAKKADLDLDLCMDVVRIVDGRAVDCIVLVSGDGDFIPMLDYCSDHGVRVEVAAFDESMSATLRQSCDLFINLSMLEEVRA